MGFDYERLSNGCFELPKGWSITNVGKVADVNSRTIQKDYDHEWIEYIDIASVERGIINETQHLLLSQAPSRAKRIVRNNDILISSVRPNLEHYVFLKHTKPNMIASTGFVVVSAKDADSRYLYYYLTSKPFTEYLSRIADSHTSAYPSFNPDVIQNAELLLPPHPEQKAIAHVLGTLDDKIELNRRMNETLEAMARAIFKSWFVDFDPVRAKSERRDTGLPKEISDLFPSSFVDSELGEVPKGWKVGVLDELTEMMLGGDWGKDELNDNFTEPAYCIRGADIPSLQSGGVGKMPLRFLKDSSLEKRTLKPCDLVVEISGGSPTQSTGRPVLITNQLLRRLDSPLICSNFCRMVKLKDSKYSIFVYLWLRRLYANDEFLQYENGTTGIKNFAFSLFSSLNPLIIPPKIVIYAFEEMVNSYYSLHQENGVESESLCSIRDNLLPKLISGEIRVKNV